MIVSEIIVAKHQVLLSFIGPASSVTILGFALSPEWMSALSIVVAAVFIGIVNLYIAQTSRLVAIAAVDKAIAPIAKTVNELVPVVAKIDGHVNSEKTKSEGELSANKLEIALQREMINELKNAAALLAQAKATADTSSVVARAAVAGSSTAPMPPVTSPPRSA